MKITANADGTVTVLIPKADEVYDPVDAALYIPCVVTIAELTDAVAEAKRAVRARKSEDES